MPAAPAHDRATGVRHEPLRVAVIGAGMAGILCAIKLREAGIADVTVYEKADRVGGTWRENTYPGLSCDVPSHLYSYSFAPNATWSHTFSPGPEIEQYFEGVASRHDVLDLVRFGDEVVSCQRVGAGAGGRWVVTTAAGVRDEVDVVLAATGVLHHPRYPDIEGLDRFAGPVFHSARWDHSVELDGARVGLVGTGSTGVQITGAIAGRVGELHLFQRTAQWIMPAHNVAYSEDERAAFAADPDSMRTLHRDLSTLFDGFSVAVIDESSPQMHWIEETCRRHLEDQVRDPGLRARLTPDYRAGCKRLILSGDFYDAVQLPHVEVVTEPITRVEPGGVRTAGGPADGQAGGPVDGPAGGRLHELDVLVLATGFVADAFVRPMEVVGRDGAMLSSRWSQRPTAYLSISVPEFPNFFMLNGPNGPVGNFSLIEVAELQLGYILQLLEPLRSGSASEVCATATALDRFEDDRLEASARTIWSTGCRSWYLDDRGVPAVWPWAFERFRKEMVAPDWDAYECS